MGEASRLDVDIVIPVGEFAGTIAGTEHFTELRESMTMSSETTSPFRAEKNQAETKSYIERVVIEAEDNASEYVEAQQIFDTVKEQLLDTGVYNAKSAGLMAEIVPAWATVYAKKNGMKVAEVFEMAGLTIEGPQTGKRADLEGQLNQPGEVAFDNWFTGSKITDDSGVALEVYHGSKEAGFTEFDTTGSGKTDGSGAFFSSSRSIAETYSNSSDAVEFVNAADVISNPDNYDVEIEEADGVFTVSSPNGYEYEGDTALEAINDMIKDGELGETNSRGNYSVYLSMKNPMEIDAGGANWDAIGAETEWYIRNEDGELVEYFNNESDADFAASTFEDDNGYYPEIVEQVGEGTGQSTDELAREARELGHDGLIVTNVIDEGPSGQGYNDESTIYVVFEPTQIKSATGNSGAFDANDPNILAQEGQNNLVVTHNLSAENIIAAAELGGLAAPSIAVVRTDISEFDAFGEVSLLADPSLLESPKARNFDADVYSPRQPRGIYDINVKKFNELDATMSDARTLNLSKPDISSLESGAENLQRSNAMQYAWLKEQGKEPKLKNKKIEATV